jgi:hypothetical protein
VPVVVGIESRAVPGVTDPGVVGDVTIPVLVPPLPEVLCPYVLPVDIPPAVLDVPPAPDAPPAPDELLCARAPAEVAASNAPAAIRDSVLDAMNWTFIDVS